MPSVACQTDPCVDVIARLDHEYRELQRQADASSASNRRARRRLQGQTALLCALQAIVNMTPEWASWPLHVQFNWHVIEMLGDYRGCADISGWLQTRNGSDRAERARPKCGLE
jgi:hypothetical protein